MTRNYLERLVGATEEKNENVLLPKQVLYQAEPRAEWCQNEPVRYYYTKSTVSILF